MADSSADANAKRRLVPVPSDEEAGCGTHSPPLPTHAPPPQSLSNTLREAEPILAPVLRQQIHHSVQQFVQGDLLPALHRADKNRRPILTTPLQLRTLGRVGRARVGRARVGEG